MGNQRYLKAKRTKKKNVNNNFKIIDNKRKGKITRKKTSKKRTKKQQFKNDYKLTQKINDVIGTYYSYGGGGCNIPSGFDTIRKKVDKINKKFDILNTKLDMTSKSLELILEKVRDSYNNIFINMRRQNINKNQLGEYDRNLLESAEASMDRQEILRLEENKRSLKQKNDLYQLKKDKNLEYLIKKEKIFEKQYKLFKKFLNIYQKQMNKYTGRKNIDNEIVNMKSIAGKIEEIRIKRDEFNKIPKENLKQQEKDIRKLYKIGIKCISKWNKLLEYDDKFKNKENIYLNKSFTLARKNETYRIYIVKSQRESNSKIEKIINKWNKETQNFYEIIKQLVPAESGIVSATNTSDSNKNYFNIRNTIKNIQVDILRIIDLIEQTRVEQFDENIIRDLKHCNNFLEQISKNFNALEKDLTILKEDFNNEKNSKILKNRISSFVKIHIENVQNLFIIQYYLENINNDKKLSIFSRTAPASEVSSVTRMQYRTNLRTNPSVLSGGANETSTQILKENYPSKDINLLQTTTQIEILNVLNNFTCKKKDES